MPHVVEVTCTTILCLHWWVAIQLLFVVVHVRRTFTRTEHRVHHLAMVDLPRLLCVSLFSHFRNGSTRKMLHNTQHTIPSMRPMCCCCCCCDFRLLSTLITTNSHVSRIESHTRNAISSTEDRANHRLNALNPILTSQNTHEWWQFTFFLLLLLRWCRSTI